VVTQLENVETRLFRSPSVAEYLPDVGRRALETKSERHRSER
jgi:hypothetical protein